MGKDNANTEQAILQAAENEFFEKGFDGARTVSIAEKAGVTHAMLHYYFRTKEQLFERIFNDKSSLMINAVLESLSNPGVAIEDRIINAVRIHFSFIERNPELPLFIVRDLGRNGDIFHLFRDKVSILFPHVDDIQKSLDEAAAEGRTAKINLLDLLVDIVCLNIAPFLIKGIALPILSAAGQETSTFFKDRCEENVELISRRLKRI